MRTARVALPGLSGIVEAEVLDDGQRLRVGGYTCAAQDAHFAPVSEGLVYGVVLNERAAVEALGSALRHAPYNAPPKAPVLFIKPRNTHAGHAARVPLPAGAAEVEVLGALGIVIASQATRVTAAQAIDCIRGYTVAADLSLPQRNLYRPPIREKCFDRSCPLGPWIVSSDRIPDPQALEVQVHVADRLEQRRSMRDLVRSVPELIADVTAFLTLYPGDVLLASAAHEGPMARIGESIAVEIPGVGRLACTIAGASA